MQAAQTTVAAASLTSAVFPLHRRLRESEEAGTQDLPGSSNWYESSAELREGLYIVEMSDVGMDLSMFRSATAH